MPRVDTKSAPVDIDHEDVLNTRWKPPLEERLWEAEGLGARVICCGNGYRNWQFECKRPFIVPTELSVAARAAGVSGITILLGPQCGCNLDECKGLSLSRPGNDLAFCLERIR